MAMSKKSQNKKAIFEYIKRNHIKQPVQLGIKLEKVIKDPYQQGRDRRYFRIYIEGHDVTQMVSNALDYGKTSNARGLKGTMIVAGSGMDMGLMVQNDLSNRAKTEGYGNMFDPQKYRVVDEKSFDKDYSQGM